MTAMHHEPVADRLGIPTHQLPADWRSRGGGGGGMGGGGQPPRSGCSLWLLMLPISLVLAAVDWITGHERLAEDAADPGQGSAVTGLWTLRLWAWDHRTAIHTTTVLTGATLTGATGAWAIHWAAAGQPTIAAAVTVAAALGLYLLVAALTPAPRTQPAPLPPLPPLPGPDQDHDTTHPRSTR